MFILFEVFKFKYFVYNLHECTTYLWDIGFYIFYLTCMIWTCLSVKIYLSILVILLDLIINNFKGQTTLNVIWLLKSNGICRYYFEQNKK